MNQPKRVNKGRGGTGGGFNRDRGRRGYNSANSFNQNDESKSHNGEAVYQNRVLIHAITKLMGCRVTLETSNGEIYDGILKTMSPKGDLVLEMAHVCAKRNEHQKIEECIQVPSKNQLIDTIVLGAKNVVYVSVSNVDLDEVKKDNFTDQAISSRGLNGQLGSERQLQKWEDPSVEPDESLSLDEHNVNGLDPHEMFLANEKFGVKSSYDREMLSYTTPVEGSKELEYKAERLAREIEKESNFRDRAEADSGKTEEQLFSAVVRNSSSERSQTPKVKHASPARDDSKQDGLDSPKSISPKPQRIQQREPNVPDGINKPVTVTPVEQVNQYPVKKIQPHAVGGEQSQSSPTQAKAKPTTEDNKIHDNYQVQMMPSTQAKTTAKPTNDDNKDPKELKHELKQFSENFKLKPQEQEDQKKKAQVTKEQSTTNTEKQQKESSKATEQKPSDNTQKTEEKPKSKLNPEAKEFKPGGQSVINTKTPPLHPQYIYAQQQGMHRMPGYQMIRPSMKPRSPFQPPNQRFVPRDDTHGSPISASVATGSPIIAPPGVVFTAVPASHQQFPVHQMPPQGFPIISHQGGQQHYMSPQTVGLPTSQNVAQGYQENAVFVPSNMITPAPSYPGSPQPSPTSGQFHLMPQIIPQQQSNQPMPQAVIAQSGQPHQPFYVVAQQPGQQPVMHGVPGPASPMVNQFHPGPQQHYHHGN